jgi:hypothetical protein
MGLALARDGFFKKVREILWLSAIFAAGMAFSSAVIYRQEDPVEHPIFLQNNLLVPSVFFAAGKGMGTADLEAVPDLEAFIKKEITSFDKKNIPEELTVRPLTTEFELKHLYYFYVVGWIWRIFGISLQSLGYFLVLWHALSAMAVYAIFRCFMKPVWSICGAALYLTSPVNFYPLVGLRELAGVPFMLWVLWGIVYLARSCRSKKYFLLIAVILGSLIGAGTGFSGPLLVCIPPAVVALVFFPDKLSSVRLKERLISLVLFVVPIILLIMPMRGGLDSTNAHSFFAGSSSETEKNILFGHAAYEMLLATDTATYAMVSLHAQCSGNTESMVNEKSAEYLRNKGEKDAPPLWDPFLFFNGEQYRYYANSLMYKVLLYIPADIVVRAWYGVLSLPEMPFRMIMDMKERWKGGIFNSNKLFFLHSVLGIIQSKFGFLCACIMLLTCGLKSYKRAFYWSGMLAWFSGYPTFYYEFRTCFFLAFIPTLMIFLAIGKALAFLSACCLKRGKNSSSSPAVTLSLAVRRLLIFTSFSLFAILAPVLVLRIWQVHKIHSLARALAEAPLQEIEVFHSKEEEEYLIAPAETLPGLKNSRMLPAGETAWQYLAVEVDTGGQDIPIKIQYEPLQIMYDFSQTITLFGIPDNKKGSMLFFFPVYEVDMNYGDTLMPTEILQMFPQIEKVVDSDLPIEEQQWWRRGKFKGISVPESSKHAIGKMYIVSSTEDLSWLPVFQLPEDSRYLRCYKTGVIEDSFRRWVRKIKII